MSLKDYEYNDEDETYDDPQPLNCSTTESIKGGHVTYSQVKNRQSINWSTENVILNMVSFKLLQSKDMDCKFEMDFFFAV